MTTAIRVSTLLLLLFAGGSEIALAQFCALGPSATGRRSVTASIGLSQFADRSGATLGMDVAGPLSFSIGYARVMPQRRGYAATWFSGGVTYAFPLAGVRTCPTLGLGLGAFDGRGVLQTGSSGASLALGVVVTTLEAGPVELTPIVAPSYGLGRTTFGRAAAGSTWAGGFGLSAATLLRSGRWLGSGGAAFSRDGNLAFGLSAGVLF